MAANASRKSIIIAAALVMLVAGSLTAAEPDKSQVLRIEGSTTVGPIADAFAGEFKAKGFNITVNKSGSGNGATALVESRCEIAAMSRFMKDKEFRRAVDNGVMPVAHVVAMDGVCIIVHPSNPISALTTEQVRDIYKGKYTNWKQLGGANAPIVAISRDTSSGTYETFHGLVMKKQEMHGSIDYVSGNPQAQARVKTTPGAIAYVGLGFVNDEIKALVIDGVKPTKKTIAGGEYPVSRPLYLFTNGYPTLGSLAHKFVTFHLSERGQEIVADKGFVPVTDY